MNANTRLHIATRIHFGLLRHLGEGIDVGTMLKHEREAREALWVCDALGDPELAQLAAEYRRCCGLEAQRAKRGTAPQDAAWAQDTSGFGLSQIGQASAAEGDRVAAPAPRRFDPMGWWRRTVHSAR